MKQQIATSKRSSDKSGFNLTGLLLRDRFICVPIVSASRIDGAIP